MIIIAASNALQMLSVIISFTCLGPAIVNTHLSVCMSVCDFLTVRLFVYGEIYPIKHNTPIKVCSTSLGNKRVFLGYYDMQTAFI